MTGFIVGLDHRVCEPSSILSLSLLCTESIIKHDNIASTTILTVYFTAKHAYKEGVLESLFNTIRPGFLSRLFHPEEGPQARIEKSSVTYVEIAFLE